MNDHLEVSVSVPPSCSPPSETICSKINVNSRKLQVINTYSAKGIALVELLGPVNVEDSAPLVITVGHGGKYKPDYIKDRSKNSPYCSRGNLSNYDTFSTLSDLHTDEVGYRLLTEIIETFGKVPYFVISHLHRSKLDVNRSQSMAAQGDPTAEKAWYSYHDFIYQAQSKLKLRFGTVRGKDDETCEDLEGVKAIMVDLHGYAGRNCWRDGDITGSLPFIQWGYGLSANDLNLRKLDDSQSTFRLAASLANRDMESVIRYVSRVQQTENSLSLFKQIFDKFSSHISFLQNSGPKSLGSRFYSIFTSSGALDDDESKHIGAGIPSQEYKTPYAITSDSHWCNANSIQSHKSFVFYSGGYTIIQHEYLDWRKRAGQMMMNTVQIELPKQIRNGDGTDAGRALVHSKTARALSVSLMSFTYDLFGMDDGVCLPIS